MERPIQNLMLDGPRVPAKTEKPGKLVVLCHGYGSNGDDLISLAPHWQEFAPECAFVSPNAPENVPGVPGGYQWFGLQNLDQATLEAGTRRAESVLNSFINRELDRTGLESKDLILVGFSQGSMMSLFHAPRRDVAPAAVIAYSGRLTGADSLKTEGKCKPPILIVHGSHDNVVPVRSMWDAATGLGENGIGCRWHMSLGVAHGIAPDGLELGGRWIRAACRGGINITHPSPLAE